MNHIPYKGGAPAVTDTIAGHTDLFVSPLGTVISYVKAGKLHAIALASRRRNAAAPDVPSAAESGLSDCDVAFWYGLAGPKGLPRPIIERINTEVTTILKTRETTDWLQADGRSASEGTPEQFQATIRQEIALWREVAREAGVRP